MLQKYFQIVLVQGHAVKKRYPRRLYLVCITFCLIPVLPIRVRTHEGAMFILFTAVSSKNVSTVPDNTGNPEINIC